MNHPIPARLQAALASLEKEFANSPAFSLPPMKPDPIRYGSVFDNPKSSAIETYPWNLNFLHKDPNL